MISVDLEQWYILFYLINVCVSIMAAKYHITHMLLTFYLMVLSLGYVAKFNKVIFEIITQMLSL